MTIHRQLRKARLKNDLTLQEVQGLTGVHYTHLSQLERGLTKPRLATIGRLLDAYGLTPTHLRRR